METQSRYHDTRGCSAGMCPLFWPWSQAERELLNQWAKQIKCDPWQKDAWYALMLHWYGWYGWNQRLDAWDTMTYHEDLLTQQTLQISSDCFRQSSSFFSASQCKCLQNSTDLYRSLLYCVYIWLYLCTLCVCVYIFYMPVLRDGNREIDMLTNESYESVRSVRHVHCSSFACSSDKVAASCICLGNWHGMRYEPAQRMSGPRATRKAVNQKYRCVQINQLEFHLVEDSHAHAREM